MFNQRLSDKDWSDVLECNDVDKAWDLFKQRFIAVLFFFVIYFLLIFGVKTFQHHSSQVLCVLSMT